MPDPVDYSRHDIEDDGFITVVPASRPSLVSPALGIWTVQGGEAVLIAQTGVAGTLATSLTPAEARMLAIRLLDNAEAVERDMEQANV